MEKLLSLSETLLFFHARLSWLTLAIQDFSSRSISIARPSPSRTVQEYYEEQEQRSLTQNSRSSAKDDEHECLSGEELGAILARMALCGFGDGGGLLDSISCGAVSSLFHEEEPSLEELKEAFCIFDENGDGFIDAEELRRVLARLGFVERVELEDCKKAIRDFDTNRDGKIDFIEFAKLMERSFC